jgi:hypothetical protein
VRSGAHLGGRRRVQRPDPELARSASLFPQCRAPVRGCDLLVAGRCPNCGKALTSLLLPAPRANFARDEYLALVGALGVLVGLALASIAENAG